MDDYCFHILSVTKWTKAEIKRTGAQGQRLVVESRRESVGAPLEANAMAKSTATRAAATGQAHRIRRPFEVSTSLFTISSVGFTEYYDFRLLAVIN